MSRCLFCCVDDFFGIGVHCQSCDVFGDCAVKQLHALGQITDMVPQGIWFIIVQRCAIQSNFATCRSPHACDCSGQSRFARTRGADNAHRTAWLDNKTHCTQGRLLLARWDDCYGLCFYFGAGFRQGGFRRLWWNFTKKCCQRLPSFACALNHRPLTYGQFNRS